MGNPTESNYENLMCAAAEVSEHIKALTQQVKRIADILEGVCAAPARWNEGDGFVRVRNQPTENLDLHR